MTQTSLKSPLSICWNITNRCNDNCQFCFRNETANELDIFKNNFILDKFIDAGVKKISFIGGEPLVYDSLDFLLAKAKKAGIITSLTSNALLITKEWLDAHEHIVDWLTLSLDGSTSASQIEMTRNKNHFMNVSNVLQYILDNNLDYNLKINTVASRINVNDIENIYDFIKDKNIKRWKIFKFYSVRGMSKKNEAMFSLSSEEYLALKTTIDNRVEGDSGLKIEFIDDDKLDSHHFIVFPNGDASATQNGKDYIKGNVLTDPVSSIWNKYFDDVEEHLESHKWLIG